MAQRPVSGEATDVDSIDIVLMQRKGARAIRNNCRERAVSIYSFPGWRANEGENRGIRRGALNV
jgi:hypothetical protein